MTFISFIIPVFNTPQQVLDRCVKSILALPLTQSQREIIVIDDGSDQPVKVNEAQVIRTLHQGVSKARNEGLKKAQGLYVQFVDADDELVLNHYRAVLLTLWKKRPDAVGFAFNIAKRRPRPWGTCSGVYYMRRYNIFGSVCSYAFLRDLLKDKQFNPQLDYSEDEEFTAKVLLDAKKLIVLNRPAYVYHLGKQSVTQQQDETAIRKRLTDNFKMIKSLDWYLYHLEGKQYKALQRRIRVLAADYLHNVRRLTHSRKQRKERLCQAKKDLASLNLYPLPVRLYSIRYLFSALRK